MSPQAFINRLHSVLIFLIDDTKVPYFQGPGLHAEVANALLIGPVSGESFPPENVPRVIDGQAFFERRDMVAEAAEMALHALSVGEVEAEVVFFEIQEVGLGEARLFYGVASGLGCLARDHDLVFDVPVVPWRLDSLYRVLFTQITFIGD